MGRRLGGSLLVTIVIFVLILESALKVLNFVLVVLIIVLKVLVLKQAQVFVLHWSALLLVFTLEVLTQLFHTPADHKKQLLGLDFVVGDAPICPLQIVTALAIIGLILLVATSYLRGPMLSEAKIVFI